MTEIHSCSYFCTRPKCALAQRDELREMLYPSDTKPPNDAPVVRLDGSKLTRAEAKKLFDEGKPTECCGGDEDDCIYGIENCPKENMRRRYPRADRGAAHMSDELLKRAKAYGCDIRATHDSLMLVGDLAARIRELEADLDAASAVSFADYGELATAIDAYFKEPPC